MGNSGKVPDIKNNIKKYVNEKKMETYSDKKKALWIMIIDILIVIITLATLYFIFFIDDKPILDYFGYAAIILIVCFGVFKFISIGFNGFKGSSITKVILVDDDGVSIKTWNIKGKVSLLIGKNSNENEVDIDLSDTTYSSLVSRQHAVMNFAKDNWYIEDIGSSNGTGLKKENDDFKLKLEAGKQYELSVGDTLYIANTKLVLK
ncbi:MAG TPA: FHA domain-containing protein [Pseudobacteroides sp.]|nr:FHA domain-containing protein [Pseudobacteroides sp.]